MELIFLTGILMSQWEELRAVYFAGERRFRLRRILPGAEDPAEARRHAGPVRTHLERLLAACGLTGRSWTSEGILLGTGTAAVLSGISVFWLAGPGTAVLTGLSVCLFPYLLLRLKLSRMQVRASMEGDLMVREILCNYKIYGCNMKEAIEVTARTLKNAPNSRKLLYDLAKGFNRAYTRSAIEEELARFQYALGTAWGAALARIIGLSQLYGWKVTDALEDLSSSLARSRQVIEHTKRENQEARLMLRYLVPVSYGLSVVCACRFFGFTFRRFLQYQFGTPAGLRWFLITAVIYTGSLMLGEILGKERMDL